MVLGCGVDIVNIRQMERAITRWGDRFLRRVYTMRELAYGQQRTHPSEFYAARFAAKEAVIKAFGAWRDELACPLQSIEVIADATGRPIVHLSGASRRLQHRSRATDVLLSLSHTHDYAVASVIVARNRS